MATVGLISADEDSDPKSPSARVAPQTLTSSPYYAWHDQEEYLPKKKSQNRRRSKGSDNFLIIKDGGGGNACKYVELPMPINTNNKDNKDGEARSLVPHLDDRSISLKIIRTVRSKRRKESGNALSKFLCPPYFILLLSLVEIIIYTLNDQSVYDLLIYCPKQGHEAWRFISYMFLHSGIIHLTLNIIIQMLLATPLEWEQGWWRCAIVYLGGGVVGAIGASLLQPNLCVVGSSAGVYALLISHVSNVILRYSTIKYKGYRLFAVAVLAISDIAFCVAQSYADIDNVPKIGWAAHCAGAFAGVTIGLLVFKGGDKSALPIRLSIWISAFSLASVIVGGVLYNLLFNIV